MINTFLNAKHWQLFLLTFGVQILVQLVWMISIFSNISFDSEPEMEDILTGMPIYIVLLCITAIIQFGWIWSAGTGLQKYIPEALRMKTAFFNFCFIFQIVFLLIYLGFIWQIFNNIEYMEDEFPFSLLHLLWLIPFSLFMAFCAIYTYWFSGKALKTAELKRELKFGDFMAEFVLFWFYPVGVWIIQPKIKKLMEQNEGLPLN